MNPSKMPWRADFFLGDMPRIVSVDGHNLATIHFGAMRGSGHYERAQADFDIAKVNALFIVRACNAHNEAVAALDVANRWISGRTENRVDEAIAMRVWLAWKLASGADR